jgi:hypothetical protein
LCKFPAHNWTNRDKTLDTTAGVRFALEQGQSWQFTVVGAKKRPGDFAISLTRSSVVVSRDSSACYTVTIMPGRHRCYRQRQPQHQLIAEPHRHQLRSFLDRHPRFVHANREHQWQDAYVHLHLDLFPSQWPLEAQATSSPNPSVAQDSKISASARVVWIMQTTYCASCSQVR